MPNIAPTKNSPSAPVHPEWRIGPKVTIPSVASITTAPSVAAGRFWNSGRDSMVSSTNAALTARPSGLLPGQIGRRGLGQLPVGGEAPDHQPRPPQAMPWAISS